LATGNFWSYIAEGGFQETKVVIGQVPIFQGSPFAIEYTLSDANQGLVNYWTAGPDGDVLLWGFFREGWGYLYQPPVRMADAPLELGKSWTTSVNFFSLPDTIPVQAADLTFTVFEDQALTVPAGVFPSFGIGIPDPVAKNLTDGRHTLWGEVITDKSGSIENWYSLGVGMVQYSSGGLFQLETYTDRPVEVKVSSWGSVKALYRE
jgi:hypothetical protein